MTKVGLDFGKTIASFEEDKPFDNAFEVIKMIINKYTNRNVLCYLTTKKIFCKAHHHNTHSIKNI